MAISDAETVKLADSITTEFDVSGTVIILLATVVLDVLIVPGVTSSAENSTVSFGEILEFSKIARGGALTLPET